MISHVVFLEILPVNQNVLNVKKTKERLKITNYHQESLEEKTEPKKDDEADMMSGFGASFSKKPEPKKDDDADMMSAFGASFSKKSEPKKDDSADLMAFGDAFSK